MIEISGSLQSPPLKRISSSKSNERGNQATAKQFIKYKLDHPRETFHDSPTNNSNELLASGSGSRLSKHLIDLLNQPLFNFTSLNFQFNNHLLNLSQVYLNRLISISGYTHTDSIQLLGYSLLNEKSWVISSIQPLTLTINPLKRSPFKLGNYFLSDLKRSTF